MTRSSVFYKKPNNFFLIAGLTLVLVFVAIELDHVSRGWIILTAFLFLLWYYLSDFNGWRLKIEDNQTLVSVTGLLRRKTKIDILNIGSIRRVSRIAVKGGTYPVIFISYKDNNGSDNGLDVLEGDYDKETIGRLIKKLTTLNKTINVDDSYRDEVLLGFKIEIIAEVLSTYAPQKDNYIEMLRKYSVPEDFDKNPSEISNILQFAVGEEIPLEDIQKMQKEILERLNKLPGDVNDVKFYESTYEKEWPRAVVMSFVVMAVYFITYMLFSS